MSTILSWLIGRPLTIDSVPLPVRDVLARGESLSLI